MTVTRTLTLGLLGLACAAACNKYDDPYEDPLSFMAPVATSEALTYVDQTRNEILFVIPGEDALELNQQPIGDDRDVVLWSRATRNGSELLALTAPASEKEEDVEEILYRFPASGDGEPVEYTVGAPFQSVALSPDYRHAVLYNAQGQLQNDNLVAIVDLTGTDDPRVMTLRGFGGRLTSVHFPAQTEEGVPATIKIGSHNRDIVAFLAEGEVVMVDMDNSETDEVAVEFPENLGFLPVDTLLRPQNSLYSDPVLFVRSQYGSDVAMLRLVDKNDEVTGEPGFTAGISLIPAGNGATDFVFHDDSQVPYLITVDESRGSLVFTDIGSQHGFPVDLGGSARHVFLRDHDTGSGTVRQAVAWQQGGRTLHTLDLENVASTEGQNPEHMSVDTGIDELVQLDNDRLLIGSGTYLYVVDLANDQVTPLSSQVPYDPTSSALDENLLLLGTPGQVHVSSVDLKTLNPESMVLDDPIQSFHYLPDAHKLMMVHSDPIGHVTVTSATEPSRGTSYVVWGFLLEGLLDR